MFNIIPPFQTFSLQETAEDLYFIWKLWESELRRGMVVNMTEGKGLVTSPKVVVVATSTNSPN